MASSKKTAAIARQLFKLSLVNGRLSEERVGGALAWVEKHRPPNSLAVLRAYRHLVRAEVNRNRAVIEYAGDAQSSLFAVIAESMSHRFGRPIEAAPRARPELIAGLRVQVGCDIFENTVAGQLAALTTVS